MPSFKITGEVIAQTARNLMLSEKPSRAWKLLSEVFLEDDDALTSLKRGVLEGTLDLVGDSQAGVGTAEIKDEVYCRQLDYIYAGRWRASQGWYRPCAVVVGALDAPVGTGSNALRQWNQLRAAYFCAPREITELVELEGQAAYVIFEPCGEFPSWKTAQNTTAQEAVVDALRAGRNLDLRGEPHLIRLCTDQMIEYGEWGDEAAQELRELSYKAEDEAQSHRHQEIGQRVRAQASENTFLLTLLDGRSVAVPKAPFMCWAVSRVPDLHEQAPPWEAVSGSGEKMPNDDPYHTDWVLGAGLTLEEAYKDNVNQPAWDEVGRIQEQLRQGGKPFAGIFAALEGLRQSSIQAAIVVDAGPVSGTVGEDIVVLPDLSPLHVPEIENAVGVIAETGGQTSHLAVVAKGQQKTVMQVPEACRKFPSGARLKLDPKSGRVLFQDEEVEP